MRQHPNSSSSQTVWMTEHYKLTSNAVCTVLWSGSIVHMHAQAKTSKVFKGSYIKPLSKWFQMYVRVSNTCIYRLNLQVHTAFHVIAYIAYQIPYYDILFLHLSRTIVDHRILKKCLPVLSLRAWRPSSTHEDAEQIYTPIKLPTSDISHLWKGNITVQYLPNHSKKRLWTWNRETVFRKWPSSDFHRFPIRFPTKRHSMEPMPGPAWWPSREAWPFGNNFSTSHPDFGADETSSETISSARSGLVDMELENIYIHIYI